MLTKRGFHRRLWPNLGYLVAVLSGFSGDMGNVLMIMHAVVLRPLASHI